MKHPIQQRVWQLLALFTVIMVCTAASCKKTGSTAQPETPQPPTTPGTPTGAEVAFWLTTGNRTTEFKEQPKPRFGATPATGQAVIDVSGTQTYQQMDGFGFTLTGGSAQHLIRMSAPARAAILRELFDTTGSNIGISYLRLSIGASDLNETVFSYNDLPAGETDPEIKKFDFGPDKQDVLPVLKEILAINPKIIIMGSPWSPPVWMKDNGDTRGGSLKPEWYDAYARYLIRYIQEMKKEGVRIDAITIQNEPLHPGNNPSLLMTAAQQAAFIKQSLGPQFKAAGIDTKIIIYDHNADRPDYPLAILNDPEAKKYVDGSAFHLYAGPITALGQVHDAHPDKHIYFTEQWIGAPGNFSEDLKWHIRTLIVGATRNWARNVLQWNLANGPDNKPHTDRGGCTACLGGITISGDAVTRNPAYYIVAHAAKFVRPGSVRVGSNEIGGLPNVAFRRPDGKHVLVVLNDGTAARSFGIRHKGQTALATLEAGAVGTFVW
ncbi:glycoside hydrolase family 30 protein [Pseudocnuella soli]|uniref:glycoside hydrolase family 30 protein n=1 Tax=Pseudocnuella soli TaxID=2502779 RepID=UPI001F022C4E|nr:glycoside hydrolase family 30 beta sandwich domain-containing protein [Pseudocnuella soli]